VFDQNISDRSLDIFTVGCVFVQNPYDRCLTFDDKLLELQQIITSLRDFCDVTSATEKLENLKQKSAAVLTERSSHFTRLEKIIEEWVTTKTNLDSVYAWISRVQTTVDSLGSHNDQSFDETLQFQEVWL